LFPFRACPPFIPHIFVLDVLSVFFDNSALPPGIKPPCRKFQLSHFPPSGVWSPYSLTSDPPLKDSLWLSVPPNAFHRTPLDHHSTRPPCKEKKLLSHGFSFRRFSPPFFNTLFLDGRCFIFQSAVVALRCARATSPLP